MKRFFQRHRISVSLVCIGLVVAPFEGLQAAGGVNKNKSDDTMVVSDVALAPGNFLTGAVVTADNKFCIIEAVVVLQENRVIAQGVTDAQGSFRIKVPGGGRYLLSTNRGGQFIRAWAPGAAPPGAHEGILLTQQSSLQLGQSPAGEMFTSTPFLIGALIAAAVAIPIAVSNSRKQKSGS